MSEAPKEDDLVVTGIENDEQEPSPEEYQNNVPVDEEEEADDVES